MSHLILIICTPQVMLHLADYRLPMSTTITTMMATTMATTVVMMGGSDGGSDSGSDGDGSKASIYYAVVSSHYIVPYTHFVMLPTAALAKYFAPYLP